MARTCVIKLGGSLLDLPDLPRRIGIMREVCRELAGERQALVVGGGVIADSVRDWDRRFALPAELSHRLSIDAMQFHAEILAALLPNSRLIHTVDEVSSAWSQNQLAVVAATDFLRNLPRAMGETVLTPGWDVTSDSIAAVVASVLRANALILAKSCDLPAGLTVADAAADGRVDARFPLASVHVARVGWMNARSGTDARRDSLMLQWWTNR